MSPLTIRWSNATVRIRNCDSAQRHVTRIHHHKGIRNCLPGQGNCSSSGRFLHIEGINRCLPVSKRTGYKLTFLNIDRCGRQDDRWVPPFGVPVTTEHTIPFNNQPAGTVSVIVNGEIKDHIEQDTCVLAPGRPIDKVETLRGDGLAVNENTWALLIAPPLTSRACLIIVIDAG